MAMTYFYDTDKSLLSISEKVRLWKAEKKKAEEEIKVGDEVKDLSTSNTGIVLSTGQMIVYITNLHHVYSNTRGSLEKTGRHFDEVEQLLDKLNLAKLKE